MSVLANINNMLIIFSVTFRDAGTGGAAAPPGLLLGGEMGAKVPFKYKEYYITSFQSAFS